MVISFRKVFSENIDFIG